MTIRELIQKIEDLKRANLAGDDDKVWLSLKSGDTGEVKKVTREPGYLFIEN